MKRKLWILFPAAFVAAVALMGSIPPAPSRIPQVPPDAKVIVITYVRPEEVFPGDFATVYGFNLDARNVKELWLLDGKTSFKVEIMEQGPHSIMVRLPNWLPPGRWQLGVLTDPEMMIEQGVYLKVRPYHGWPTG